MTGSAWAAASLLLLHLGATGAIPKEVPTWHVRSYAVGEQPVRILIAKDGRTVTLRASADAVVEDPDTGERLAVVSAGAPAQCAVSPAGVGFRAGSTRFTRPALVFRPEKGTTKLSTTGGWGTRGAHSGALELRAASRGLAVVEQTDLESYVAGVVAAEVPRDFPLQAVASQAIAARTYALFHLGDHLAEGADLCAQVHCQAYLGAPRPNTRAAHATRQTAGQVLAWHGVLVDAQYHAACGGSTVAGWETRQGKLLPYLGGTPDRRESGAAFCADGHSVTWSRRVSLSEAQGLVSRNLGKVIGEPGLAPGRLLGLRVKERAADRAKWLQVVTDTGTYRVMGDSIRWLFGNGSAGPTGLRSNRFALTTEKDRRGRAKAFLFRGAGHGHGIGMCQWGARGRALAGYTATEILATYYPGVEVIDLRLDAPAPRALESNYACRALPALR